MKQPSLQEVMALPPQSLQQSRHDSIMCIDMTVYAGTLEQAYEELKAFAGDKTARWGWDDRGRVMGFLDGGHPVLAPCQKISVRVFDELLEGMTQPVTDQDDFEQARRHIHKREVDWQINSIETHMRTLAALNGQLYPPKQLRHALDDLNMLRLKVAKALG